MKTRVILVSALVMLGLVSCNRNGELADAYGYFEVDETIISAQVAGELVQFSVDEGRELKKGQFIGMVDTTGFSLSKKELRANQAVLNSNLANIDAQIRVKTTELKNLEREQKRIENLVSAGASTQKNLDDINGNVDVVKASIQALQTQKSGVKAQVSAINSKINQVDDQIQKSKIVNPLNGTVLRKLVYAHEFVNPGKPLYKIAPMNELTLRVYVPGEDLSTLKINGEYTVKVDTKDGELLSYPAVVYWISQDAEFSPKTIQTKEERVELVYAVKLRVKNDGSLKIGMPGELWIQQE